MFIRMFRLGLITIIAGTFCPAGMALAQVPDNAGDAPESKSDIPWKEPEATSGRPGDAKRRLRNKPPPKVHEGDAWKKHPPVWSINDVSPYHHPYAQNIYIAAGVGTYPGGPAGRFGSPYYYTANTQYAVPGISLAGIGVGGLGTYGPAAASQGGYNATTSAPIGSGQVDSGQVYSGQVYSGQPGYGAGSAVTIPGVLGGGSIGGGYPGASYMGAGYPGGGYTGGGYTAGGYMGGGFNGGLAPNMMGPPPYGYGGGLGYGGGPGYGGLAGGGLAMAGPQITALPGMMPGDPYLYHFGPGFYRYQEAGHYRFPWYSYRRPWYFPGHPSYNRDTNIPW